MSYQPRVRDIAHLGSVELFTPRLAETTDFFVRLMSLDEVARHGDSVYLHAWDDYQAWTLKITQRDLPGIGRTYLRASDPDALRRRVDALADAGVAGTWNHDEPAFGSTWVCADPDGHEYGLYWETSYFAAAPRPALKNQERQRLKSEEEPLGNACRPIVNLLQRKKSRKQRRCSNCGVRFVRSSGKNILPSYQPPGMQRKAVRLLIARAPLESAEPPIDRLHCHIAMFKSDEGHATCFGL